VSDVPFNGRVLRVGSHGLDVAAVHIGLRRAGRDVKLGRLFTSHLRDQLKIYQHSVGLKDDGVYGEETHKHLRTHFNRYATMIYKMAKRNLPRYVDVQGAAVPRQLAVVILPSLHAVGATIFSCYRGQDPQGVAILHKHGKRTQYQLWYGYVHGWPGYAPANRPGTSTHELRSDGYAYPGPSGRHLEWWQCGMDIDDGHVDAFIRHLASRGINAHRPYGYGAELHHVNLRTEPPRRLWVGK